MATILQGETNVSTTAVSIAVLGPEFIVRNGDDTRPVFLGDSPYVTAANGYPLLPGETLRLRVEEAQTLYAVTEAGTVTIDYFTYQVI